MSNKAIIIIACIILNCLSVRGSAAQEGAVADDIRYYRITEYQDSRDYISYSQAVRERIRQKLQAAYRDYYKDGDVNLFFIINSDGRLAKFDIDYKNSTDDKRLLDVAVLSLEGSSPFPPFPKRLYADRLPFSVLISFKGK